MADLRARLGPLHLENPVIAASGTFGFGEEYSSFLELDRLGALVVKGITLKPRAGNPPPRIVETPAGFLNSIGLQNPGLEVFLEKELPRLRKYRVPVIVNINGETEEEYVILSRELSEAGGIAALELNVSCPNVQKGGIFFGTSTSLLARLVKKVRRACRLPLMVKLSPNVTDIAEMARVAESCGADIISLVNTFKGMVIDINKRKPFLGNITGGLSGPAIRPLAVRMVYEVYQAVQLPIVGMGGIISVDDALQFFLAGAAAVAVGSANFVDPGTIPNLVTGLNQYLERENFSSLEEIIGLANTKANI